MEQITPLLGFPELRSEAESSESKTSERSSFVRQPGWPGDKLRTGSSSRQPKFEVVCIDVHRWEGDDPGTYISLQARYESGHRRTMQSKDLRKMDQFITDRVTSSTWIILNPNAISIFRWLTSTDGADFCTAFDYKPGLWVKAALDNTTVFPTIRVP